MAAREFGIPVKRTGTRSAPTGTERAIVRTLALSANIMKRWQVKNNRVATGRSVNSYAINVTKQPQLSRAINRAMNPFNHVTGNDFNKARGKFTKDLRNFELGLVSASIVAAPHTKYALQGRGPGKRPPVAVIEQWIKDKNVKSKYSDDSLAYIIARKIGEEGTDPPHYTGPMVTTLAGATARTVVKKIAPILAEQIGEQYVKFILTMAEIWDGVSMTYEGEVYGDKADAYSEFRRSIKGLE